jgi:hypothetical protein
MCGVLGLDMARLAGWRGLKVGDWRGAAGHGGAVWISELRRQAALSKWPRELQTLRVSYSGPRESDVGYAL